MHLKNFPAARAKWVRNPIRITDTEVHCLPQHTSQHVTEKDRRICALSQLVTEKARQISAVTQLVTENVVIHLT